MKWPTTNTNHESRLLAVDYLIIYLWDRQCKRQAKAKSNCEIKFASLNWNVQLIFKCSGHSYYQCWISNNFCIIIEIAIVIYYRVRWYTCDVLTQPTTEIANVAEITLAILNIIVSSCPKISDWQLGMTPIFKFFGIFHIKLGDDY